MVIVGVDMPVKILFDGAILALFVFKDKIAPAKIAITAALTNAVIATFLFNLNLSDHFVTNNHFQVIVCGKWSFFKIKI